METVDARKIELNLYIQVGGDRTIDFTLFPVFELAGENITVKMDVCPGDLVV